jgi:hypothetical protein
MSKRKTFGERIIERYGLWIDKCAWDQLAEEIDETIRKKYARVWADGYHYGEQGPMCSDDNPYRSRKKKVAKR